MDRPSLVLLKTRKLTVETFESDELLYLRFAGALDEDFAGRDLARKIEARTVVLQLADVKLISSFGIREWTDFIRELDDKVERIVLIECAQRIIDQINMVANFTGSGLVFSFYAPYRCDECATEQRVIMQVDRDWDIIKSMRPPELPCSGCGALQHFDDDPVSYFSYVVNQGPFALPEEVSVLLTSPAQYRPSVLELSRRMEVDKQVEGEYTYIRLSGDLDASFPRAKLADGLEGTVIVDMSNLGRLDPAGAAEWRTFLQMLTPAITSFSVKGMSALFLEKLGGVASLGPRAQVLDFSLVYSCTRCHATEPYSVDVAEHFERLQRGEIPAMACRECQGPTEDSASPGLGKHLQRLTRPDLDDATRAFIAKAQARKPERRATEVGVLPRARRPSKRWWLVIAASLCIAGAAITYAVTRQGATTRVVAGSPMGKLLEASAEQRPAWVTLDTELAGECRTDDNQVMSCTGVSPLLGDREEAEKQARGVAVESAVRAIGLRIDDVEWTSAIGAVYGRVRQAKVAEFSNEQLRDQRSMQYQRARDALVEGRERVVRAVEAVVDSDIDTQTATAVYWEKYQTPGVGEEKYLVFANYRLPTDSVTAMREFFSARDEALGVEVVTGFPGLAWLYPDFMGGVVVLAVADSYLRDAGLDRGDIITAIQGRPVKDVDAFVQVMLYQIKNVQQGGGDILLTVTTDDGATKEYRIPADELSF